MSDLDYNANAVRGRQQRLLAEMQKLRLDLVVVQTIEHVQWLTGARYGWVFSPAAALRSDGHLTLAAPRKSNAQAAATGPKKTTADANAPPKSASISASVR